MGSPPTASRTGCRVAFAALLIVASVTATHAAEASAHKMIRAKGGISPSPVVTGVARDKNNLTVEWQGVGRQADGTNVVYQLMNSPALDGTNSSWTAVGTVTNSTSLTMAMEGETGFLTVQQSPSPKYAGADKCLVCHDLTHGEWLTSAHAGAFETLKSINQHNNASCIGCHTAGYGTENGFQDEATTPHLAGVQCENCHGPSAEHAAKPAVKAFRPIKTLAGEMCGGCHTDAHHPTYDEWATSGHGSLEIPHEEFADPESGPGRMGTCGACHSAATRQALLRGVRDMQVIGETDPSKFAPELPTTVEAANTGITCTACHDVHGKTDNPGQLRYPVHSEMPYNYTTSKNFAANFNPQVQVCAQCHNARGASWTGTSRPPHHSPQYNVLIGDSGFVGDATDVPQSAHMKIENQCAQCHTHAHEADPITDENPNFTGHDFRPTMQGCAPCHDEIGGALITEVVQDNVKKQIAEIKGLLDEWGATKASEALRQKYGSLAWEFQNIGQLSQRTDEVPRGPSGDEQKEVPDRIKQARHNLYLIEHDGSYGVHNGNYARFLLKVARDLVTAELQL